MPTIITHVIYLRCPFHSEIELQTINHPGGRVDILPCPECRGAWEEKVRSLEEINRHYEKQNNTLHDAKRGWENKILNLQKELKNKNIAIGKLRKKGGKKKS